MPEIPGPTEHESLPAYEAGVHRPRLSLTSDILDFRKCRRKYGMLKVRGFDGSSPTAEFVGTFAHRSIEEAWQHYRETGSPPGQGTIVSYLESVRNDLLEEGRNPHSWSAVFQAGFQVLRWLLTLRNLGRYDEIVDSERTLRSGESDFVLEGVVDMILREESGPTLWDFKSAHNPQSTLDDPSSSRRSTRYSKELLQDYTLQLRIYHFLSEEFLDEGPSRCELVFLGELGSADVSLNDYSDVEEAWHAANPEPLTAEQWTDARANSDSEYARLFYSVETSAADVQKAVAEFSSTAEEIISHRNRDCWPAPSTDALPDQQTCRDCDFLESCPTAKGAKK